MKTCPPLTDEDRHKLFDTLESLPDTVRYTLTVNRDCSHSLTISGQRGHGDMPRMFVRGSIDAVIADARDYLRMLNALGRMPEQREPTGLEATS